MSDSPAYKRYMFNYLYPPHTLRRVYELYTQGFTMQQISQKMFIDPEIIEMLIVKYEEQNKYAKNAIPAVR